jgi:WxcM-like, C-terminal
MFAITNSSSVCGESKSEMTTVHDCKLLELPKISRPQGNITPAENCQLIPFDILRVYYLYDVPGGETRGGHAHKELQQLIVSVMGAFDVVLDDGYQRRTVLLNRAYYGLYMPRLIWRELVNFSSGGICLVLASLPYDENEYIRDYDLFLKYKRDARPLP